MVPYAQERPSRVSLWQTFMVRIGRVAACDGGEQHSIQIHSKYYSPLCVHYCHNGIATMGIITKFMHVVLHVCDRVLHAVTQ